MTQEPIYQGSVKDLYQDGDELVLAYSDRYSIYDWGRMPDAIPHKGAALASLAAAFFDYLHTQGIASHYVRQADAHRIVVRPVQVLRPAWQAGRYDYSAYAVRPRHTLVPLEVIFRRRLALGNSLQRRLASDPAYAQDLGLAAPPADDALFDPPLIEFSTKLERSDRYLARSDLAAMGILSDAERKQLKQQARQVADCLRELLDRIGVELWDGKLEYAWGGGHWPERVLLLVDSIGPDELRLTYEGLPLSKEFLRQLYARTPWAGAMREAKRLASARQVLDWKRICIEELGQQPQPLSSEQLQLASLLYQALANAVARAVGRPLPFDAAVDLPLWRRRAGTA